MHVNIPTLMAMDLNVKLSIKDSPASSIHQKRLLAQLECPWHNSQDGQAGTVRSRELSSEKSANSQMGMASLEKPQAESA